MYFLLLIVALFSMALLRTARAQEAALSSQDLVVESLTAETDVDFDFVARTADGKNGIVVKQGSTILVADRGHVNLQTREVVADGNVTLQGEGIYWKGEHLEFNFSTRMVGAGSYRAGLSGVFVTGETLTGSATNKTYEATNATFTTDDLSDPGYHIKAKKLRVKNGVEASAEKATLYLGNTPVFYLPYYKRNLGPHPNYWVISPGYRSSFGPYLLTEYHVAFNDKFDAGVSLDYRAKRGPGIGPEITYDLGKFGKGEGEYYFTHDWDAKNDPNLAGYSDDRQRVRFAHSVTLQTNLTAKASVNWQNDPRLLRDFFEGEYRTNAQPTTVFEVSKYWSNFSLDTLVQPQVNDFFPTVERLPDVKLSALRQQLGVTPLFYEGENSFAYLRNRPDGTSITNYAAMRADTYHQIVLPRTLFGFLNVAPRVGGRVTYYSETESEFLNLDEKERFVFNTGMETSFKASRVFPSASSHILDVTELRHIFEPSLNYVYIPRPNERPFELPQFDTELPTLRLRPVDFPDYNTIDSIDTQNVLRIGLRNKLQTKRDGEIDTLLNWYLVSDWRLDPRDGQTTFSDIYSDLDFKPQRWLLFNSEIRYNINSGDLNLSSHSVTITPGDTWSARFGHRYFAGDPAFGPDSDNNIFFTTLYYRLNENWGARMSHHFEARDGTMEEQYYTVYRDFRSFTGALTFRVRDQRAGPMDYTIAFTLSLKSHPGRAGSDRLEPSFLLGN